MIMSLHGAFVMQAFKRIFGVTACRGLILLSLGTWAGFTAASPRVYIPPIPADLAAVDLYLLTAGVGDEIANRFGHTGIRILDRRTGSDVVFNWGKFQFDSPGFAWKFFRGSLPYSLGVRTFRNDVAIYVESGRRLVMDRLHLTAQQKLALIQKIRWNAQPANREFAYQYWFKNCSTIPRDYLNEVLHDQIAARFAREPAGRVFRDYVRSNLAYVPFVVPLLDTLMNGNIDREITFWEDMFLPSRLRDILKDMPAVDDTGQPLPGTHLLVDAAVLVNASEEFAPPFPDYAALILPIAASLLVLGGTRVCARMMFSGEKRAAMERASLRAVGLGALYWGVVSGLTGCTLVLNWGFSGHPDGWANANLLFLWPLDLCLVPLGWQLLKTGSPWKDRWPFSGAGKIYFQAKALGLALLWGVHKGGVLQQDVTRVALYFGGASLALGGVLWAFGFARPSTAWMKGFAKSPKLHTGVTAPVDGLSARHTP